MSNLRNLLVLAALCWVAPLAAQQGPVVAKHQTHSHSKAGCPFAAARAKAMATQREAKTVIIKVPDDGSMSLLGRPAVFAP
jgi:hypothetical protein